MGCKKISQTDFEWDIRSVWSSARKTLAVPGIITDDKYTKHMALYAVVTKMTANCVTPKVMSKVVIEVMNHLNGEDQYLSECVVTTLLRKELIRIWRLGQC